MKKVLFIVQGVENAMLSDYIALVVSLIALFTAMVVFFVGLK